MSDFAQTGAAADIRALVDEISKTAFQQREQGQRHNPIYLEEIAGRLTVILARQSEPAFVVEPNGDRFPVRPKCHAADWVGDQAIIGEPFDKRCADALADEVAVLVRRGVIDMRSPAADALLDYRDPPSSPRADRLSEVEKANRTLVRWKGEIDQRRILLGLPFPDDYDQSPHYAVESLIKAARSGAA